MTSHTYAPHTQANTKPASEKQIAFLVRLSQERNLAPTPEDIRMWATQAGNRAVSDKITELLAMPKVASSKPAASTATYDVPEGRYAIATEDGWKFYRVDRPTEGKWAGYTFVKVQASDDLYPVKGRAARDAVLAAIEAAGPAEASRAYGRQLGACGVCGRTLTNPESIADGIGPICAGKMGF